MKVIDPGHVYDLRWLDGKPFDLQIETGHTDLIRSYGGLPDFVQNRLIFVKREGDGYPGNVGHHPGTTLQEVLRALIDRVKYLDDQIHDHRNADVIYSLREAIINLEERAAERHGRLREWQRTVVWERIEDMPTCPKCLHIGCAGNCHPQ